MSEYSGKRLENRILETISTMIVNGMIKNPNLSRFTSITEVDLSSDNANATVYVSCADERGLDKTVRALNSASGFIQTHIAKVLKTRNTPKLLFKADNSFIKGERLNNIIDEAMGRK